MVSISFFDFLLGRFKAPQDLQSEEKKSVLRRMTQLFSVKRYVALITLFLLSSANSYAQGFPTSIATNFADCNALNGTQLFHSALNPITISDSTTIASLADTDLITIDATVPLGGGTVGSVNTQVQVNSSSVINATLVVSGSTSGSFDPPGDQTAVSLSLVSEFFAAVGGGFELGVLYTITCTPDSGATSTNTNTNTSTRTAAFLAERNRRILEESPDRPRLVRSRLDSLWGGASGVSESSNLSSFSATSNGLRAHVELGNLAGTTYGADPLPVGVDPKLPPLPGRESCWDAWAEVHHTRFEDAGNRDGEFTVGYVGLDCQIRPAVLIGLLGQFDWTDDTIGSVASQIDGNGWMVGPYATVRLTPDLFFDFRAAWGQSENDINTAGVTGSFDTTRWLVEAQLTGAMQYGDYRISPEIKLSYIEENQDSFTNSANVFVPEQTVSLGRLRFGPEIARRQTLDDGTIVEPHVSFRGIWDFDATDIIIAGNTFNGEGLRGVVEAGILFHKADNFNVRISAKYDGIGLSDYEAIGGQIWINIPLN